MEMGEWVEISHEVNVLLNEQSAANVYVATFSVIDGWNMGLDYALLSMPCLTVSSLIQGIWRLTVLSLRGPSG